MEGNRGTVAAAVGAGGGAAGEEGGVSPQADDNRTHSKPVKNDGRIAVKVGCSPQLPYPSFPGSDLPARRPAARSGGGSPTRRGVGPERIAGGNKTVLDYASGNRSVTGELAVEYDKILRESTISLITLGGNAEAAARIVSGIEGPGDINPLIAENAVYSRENQGVPIA